MALKTTVPEPGSDFELPPEGVHPALLVAVIDLGTQRRVYGGKSEDKHMVYLAFEVADEQERPLIGLGYTFSLNEKANLRGVLKAIRGRDFAPGEELPTLRPYLGKPCQVTIEHDEGANDRKYAKLAGVVGAPKGYKPPAVAHTPVYWEIDSGETFPDEEWVQNLYLWGKKLTRWLEESKEWGGDKRQPAAAGTTNGAAPEAKEDIPWAVAPFLPWLGTAAGLATTLGGLLA